MAGKALPQRGVDRFATHQHHTGLVGGSMRHRRPQQMQLRRRGIECIDALGDEELPQQVGVAPHGLGQQHEGAA